MHNSSDLEATGARVRRLKPVRIWLYCVALLVLLMVSVGGFTRLTDSGLSITSWKPISGVLPPLSEADWQAEFDAYKLIPEYSIQNSWMQVNDFKRIFWPEWGHRFLGRLIGVAFLFPFLVFLAQRRLDRRLAPSLIVLFLMGGLQGVLGWWMVSSGLSARVDVSQYRLAAHLGAATLLFVALIAVARRLGPPLRGTPVGAWWWLGACGLAFLIFLQILAGGFVAGIDAGMGYNTWPLMDGQLVPQGLGAMEPWWRNLFESTLTVQFDHRVVAYTVVIGAALLVYGGYVRYRFSGAHRWLPLIGALVAGQVLLGIATLLSGVALPLALGHQALALMLVGSSVAYIADMTRVWY